MNQPQIILTPNGEEMVLLAKADYDELMAIVEEADEDMADIAHYDARKAMLEQNAPLPLVVSADILQGASRLKALRKWRGLTQSELAISSDIAQGFLSDMECGKRSASPDTLLRLCKALNIPAEWLA